LRSGLGIQSDGIELKKEIYHGQRKI